MSNYLNEICNTEYNNRSQRTLGIININNLCDLNELYQGDKLHQNCGTRKFFVDHDKKGLQILYFGNQGISKEAFEYFEVNKEKIAITKLDDLRKYKMIETNESQLNKMAPITQAGEYFFNELNSFQNKVDDIHLSISLEAINVIISKGILYNIKLKCRVPFVLG